MQRISQPVTAYRNIVVPPLQRCTSTACAHSCLTAHSSRMLDWLHHSPSCRAAAVKLPGCQPMPLGASLHALCSAMSSTRVLGLLQRSNVPASLGHRTGSSRSCCARPSPLTPSDQGVAPAVRRPHPTPHSPGLVHGQAPQAAPRRPAPSVSLTWQRPPLVRWHQARGPGACLSQRLAAQQTLLGGAPSFLWRCAHHGPPPADISLLVGAVLVPVCLWHCPCVTFAHAPRI